eukprot:m.120906 g.120906  ORF g.120906 m.120906 type:complete len:2802 (-) comp9285_c2_seq2:1154-9559(-)
MDPTENYGRPLQYGDVVSLSIGLNDATDHIGFLCSTSNAESTVAVHWVQEGEGPEEDIDKIPTKFRNCLFQVYPNFRYTAQIQYDLAAQQSHENSADLKLAADLESERNQENLMKTLGTPVLYGSSVQLLHLSSQRFVVAARRTRSQRSSVMLSFSQKGSDGAALSILPYYKHRALSTEVVAGDMVTLRAAAWDMYVHASDRDVLGHLCFSEADVVSIPIAWMLKVFCKCETVDKPMLKGGLVVRFFHSEEGKFLTGDVHPDTPEHAARRPSGVVRGGPASKQVGRRRAATLAPRVDPALIGPPPSPLVFLRVSQQVNKYEATSSKGLWEVEVVGYPRTYGAMGRWSHFYRFKHLLSEEYLCAVPDKDDLKDPKRVVLGGAREGPYYTLATTRDATSTDSVFELENATSVDIDEHIPHNSYVRIRHVASDTWLHAMGVHLDRESKGKKNKKPTMLKVGLAPERDDKEVFTVIPVVAAELRDNDFCTDIAEALYNMAANVANGTIVYSERKHQDQLLCELAAFIIEAPTAIDEPWTIKGKPNKPRQKLCREQGVLDALFATLRAPFTDLACGGTGLLIPDMAVLESSKWAWVKRICRLCYHNASLLATDYRKNQEWLAERITFMQGQIGYELGAEYAVTRLLSNNKDLTEQFITPKEINKFLDLYVRQHDSRFLQCLSGLCVCNGETVSRTQELICKAVFYDEARSNILFPTYIHKEQVVVEFMMSDAEGTFFRRTKMLISFADPQDDLETKLLQTYERQLDLCCHMCLDRQYIAIHALAARLPIGLLLVCMRERSLPAALRALFCRLMLHIHVDAKPQKAISPIRFVRLWRLVPTEIEAENYTFRDGYLDDDVSQPAMFFGTVGFVCDYWCLLERAHAEAFALPDRNTLSLHVTKLTRYMIQFGFFNFRELMELSQRMLRILDDTLCSPRWGDGGPPDETVLEIQLQILEIIDFALSMSLDYRISQLLATFRACRSLQDKEPSDRWTMDDRADVQEFICRASRIFDLGGSTSTADPGLAGVDGDFGRRLLRVTVNLILCSSMDVVKSAIRVLLRGFSTRDELLRAAGNIQLLVREEETQVFQRTLFDLDIIGRLAEESELWVAVEKEETKRTVDRDSTLPDDREKSPGGTSDGKTSPGKLTPTPTLGEKLSPVGKTSPVVKAPGKTSPMAPPMLMLPVVAEETEPESIASPAPPSRLSPNLVSPGTALMSPGGALIAPAMPISFKAPPDRLSPTHGRLSPTHGRLSPSRSLRPGSPSQSHRPVSPSQSLRPVSPSQPHRAVSPSQHLRSVSPTQPPALQPSPPPPISPSVPVSPMRSPMRSPAASPKTRRRSASDGAQSLPPLPVSRVPGWRCMSDDSPLPRLSEASVGADSTMTMGSRRSSHLSARRGSLEIEIPLMIQNDETAEEIAIENYGLIRGAMLRMASLCVGHSRRHYQTMLRNLGAHEQAIKLLQISFPKLQPATEMLAAIFALLRAMVDGNADAQAELSKHTAVYQTYVPRNVGALQFLVSLYEDNAVLCHNIPSKLLAAAFASLSSTERNTATLEFLRTVACPRHLPNPSVQNAIVDAIGVAKEEARYFLTGVQGHVTLTRMAGEAVPSADLLYHVQLVELLAVCCDGKNMHAEMKCQTFLGLEDVTAALCIPGAPMILKQAYLKFLIHCTLDTEVEVRDSNALPLLWRVLAVLANDMHCYAVAKDTFVRQPDNLAYITGVVCQTARICFGARLQQAQFSGEELKIFMKWLRVANDLCETLNRVLRPSPGIIALLRALYTTALFRGLLEREVNDRTLRNISRFAIMYQGMRRWILRVRRRLSSPGYQKPVDLSTNEKVLLNDLKVYTRNLQSALAGSVHVEQTILQDALYAPSQLTDINPRVTPRHFVVRLVQYLRASTSTRMGAPNSTYDSLLRLLCCRVDPGNFVGRSVGVRASLVNRFFGTPHPVDRTRAAELLVECGGVDLCVDLLELLPSLAESALPLELCLFILGGTPLAREAFYKRLSSEDSTRFFDVIHRFLSPAALYAPGDEGALAPADLACVRMLLKFLKELCEGHYTPMQRLLVMQAHNKVPHNITARVLSMFDRCGIGSTMNDDAAGVAVAALDFLIETCQGPCIESQECITSHNNNGMDIIVAEILLPAARQGSSQLSAPRQLQLKRGATTLFLALLEGHTSDAIHQRMLFNLEFAALLDAAVDLYMAPEHDQVDTWCCTELCGCTDCRRDVGHMIYILALHLAPFSTSKEARALTIENVSPSLSMATEDMDALTYYRKFTNAIEIVRGSRFHTAIFPVPPVTRFLTFESQEQLFNSTTADDNASKMPDFYRRCRHLMHELCWQRELVACPPLFWLGQRLVEIRRIAVAYIMIINIFVALHYPLPAQDPAAPMAAIAVLLALQLLCAGLFVNCLIPLRCPDSRFRLAVTVQVLVACVFQYFEQRLLLMAMLGTMLFFAMTMLIHSHVISRMHFFLSSSAPFRSVGMYSSSISAAAVLSDFSLLYHVLCLIVNLVALVHSAAFGDVAGHDGLLLYVLLLMEVVLASPALRNMTRSVTDNFGSIVLALFFTLILVFVLGMVAYLYFQAHAIVEAGDGEPEPKCHTLAGCIATSAYYGVRDGAGLGGILRDVPSGAALHRPRLAYDLLFFFAVRIVCLNIILGIIVDTFGNLRAEKEEGDNMLHNTCFVCGLPRQEFHVRGLSFRDHCRTHSLWAYFNFLVLLEAKAESEFNGLESYVKHCLTGDQPDLSWIPSKATALLSTARTTAEREITRSVHDCNLISSTGQLVRMVSSLRHTLAQSAKPMGLAPLPPQRIAGPVLS